MASRSKSPRSKPTPKRRRASGAEGPRPIYVLSDSTGNLGRHVLTAILTQFPADAFRLEMRSFIRSAAQIEDVFRQVEAEPGVVFHGMLDPEHNRLIR